MAHTELTFAIAGMGTGLVIEGEVSDRLQEALDHFNDFHISPSTNAFQIDIRSEEGESFFKPVPGPLEIRTKLENGRVSFTSCQEQGWFDLKRQVGELTLRTNGNPENYLRMLYAYRCLDQEALLLHAGGVIQNGAAYVFFGPSGSGKTTTVSLSAGSIVLSDDLVLIQVENSGGKYQARAFGVPFRGSLPESIRTNASAVIKGLYRLRKADRHQLAELSFSKAIAELSASIPFIMSLPSNAVRALHICEKIERAVPVQNLFFRKDDGFWDVIEKA